MYAVHISGLVSNVLLFDSALLYTLSLALRESQSLNAGFWMALLCTWIVSTKIVKKVPYFRRNPMDLLYLPACILFAYVHSLIKLSALCTWWNIGWWRRDPGSEATKRTVNKERKDERKPKASGCHEKIEENLSLGQNLGISASAADDV